MRATLHGVQLALLLGATRGVNATKALGFIARMRNSDNGFSESSSSRRSTVFATYGAVRVAALVGAPMDGPAFIVDYLRGLYDSSSGLFAAAAHESGSIDATLAAVQTLELLGESGRLLLQAKRAEISAAVMRGLHVDSEGRRSFDFGRPGTMADLHSGIVVGAAVGAPLDDEAKAKLVDAIADLAVESGSGVFNGWAASRETVGTTASTHALLQAVEALNALSPSLVSSLDAVQLLDHCRGVVGGLEELAAAHLALARAGLAEMLFSVRTSLLRTDLETLIHPPFVPQGTPMVPRLCVAAIGSDTPHGALQVTARLITPDQPPSPPIRLLWSARGGCYTASNSSALQTAGLLGSVTVLIRARSSDGVLAIERSEIRRVGLEIQLTPRVVYRGHRLLPLTAIGPGATIDMDVRLFNSSHPNIGLETMPLRGALIDGAGIELSAEMLTENRTSGDIRFLSAIPDNAPLPPGPFAVRFTIAAHSAGDLPFISESVLVATAVRISPSHGWAPARATLGDTIRIEASLALSQPPLQDWTAPHTAPVPVVWSPAVGRQWRIELELSVAEAVVASVSGAVVDVAGVATASFEHRLPAHLGGLGTLDAAMYFVDVEGSRHRVRIAVSTASGGPRSVAPLQIAGATTGAAVESPATTAVAEEEEGEEESDASSFAIAVEATLLVTDVRPPPRQRDLHYGNEIAFAFTLIAEHTGRPVAPDPRGAAALVLSLSHDDASGGRVVSVSATAAAGEDGGYSLRLYLNPNAVVGAGLLQMAVQLPSGGEVPVLADGKRPLSLPVTIGGSLVVEAATHRAAGRDDGTVTYLSTLRVLCGGKRLRDASFRCRVLTPSGSEHARLSVSLSASRDEYTVSWPTRPDAPGGNYTLECSRDVDVRRGDTKPFFTVAVPHQAASGLPAWVWPLVVAAVAVVVAAATIRRK